MSIPFQRMKFWRETSNEWIYFCPLCNETSSHGHLYISKKFPVYNCFKCNCSGHINQLSKIINESCNIQYTNTIEYNLPYLDIPKILYETNELLKFYSLAISDNEKEYFRKRLGLKSITMDNIVKFSLFPDSYARKILYNDNNAIRFDSILRTWTLRGFSTGLSGRAHNIINDKTLRYINGNIETPWKSFIDSNDTYFIRSYPIVHYSMTSIPEYLIVSEGIYDICALYLHRKKYGIDDKNSVFMAVQCSNYMRAIKTFQLMYNTIPRNIIVFADIDIKPKNLKEQFSAIVNSNIVLNWPIVKDWEDYGPVKFSVEI